GAAGTHDPEGAAIGLVNSEVLPALSVTVKIRNGLQPAMLILLKLPALGNAVTKSGPSSVWELLSVKTSIVQLPPQLPPLVTLPDMLLALIDRPLSPGRLG